ncbi:MAG: glycosyltransferase family 2 protein, partial [Gemmatimonadota bacterium]
MPELSLVMPCYNEEGIVAYTIGRLLEAFERSGNRLEIIAVDNGSSDRTGEILRELARNHPEVVPFRIPENQGYGFGVLSGVPLARADWIGIIPADGQVDAEDVLHLFQAA